MTNPLQLISDTADGLADLEHQISFKALSGASVPRHQLAGWAAALRVVIAQHREFLAEQERAEPIQQPEVRDSDFAAFEQAEGKSNG